MRHKQAPVLESKVAPENGHLWQAYHHLRGSSFDGMGRKPIPFSEIAAYSEWLGISCPVQKARLVKAVITLDNAEREHRKKGAE